MTTTTEILTRVKAAQAAVTYAAKRSNRVPAVEYRRAVKELLDARAAAVATGVDVERLI